MKKNTFLAAGLALVVSSTLSFNNALAKPFNQELKSNGFLIKWKKNAKQSRLSALAKINNNIKYSRSLNIRNQHIDLVSVSESMSLKEAKILLTNIPDVEFVEPNYIYSTQANVNDPDFNLLWGLHNENDTDINVTKAWDISIGSEDVVIAVIDTGVDYTHPDLNANMWQNPNEIPNNNIDDDGNGYIDDIYGIDTANNDTDPMDDNFHGTHVAGTIAAVGNNEIGIVGVAQKAKIIGCKFLSAGGSGYIAGAIECLHYLADLKEHHNVNLVATNNSWGGGGRSELLQDAIQRHHDLGITFVAAAGNDSINTDILPSYPASYDNSNIISVAALTSSGMLSDFSNWGSETVDIAAPGWGIYSTVPGGSYESLNGTSMAAPHVTGALVLLASYKPELSMTKQINLVLSAYRENHKVSGKIKTGGQLLAYGDNNDGILNCENKITTRLISPKLTNERAIVQVGDEVVISVNSQNCYTPNSELDKTVNIQTIGNQTLVDDGTGADEVAGDGIFSTSFVVETDAMLQVDFVDESISAFTVKGIKSPEIGPDGYIYSPIEGTALNLSDDETKTIELPFEFTGASGVFSHITVSSNGLIFLGESGHTSYQNTALPNAEMRYEFIAPYWRDLIAIDKDAGYFYEVKGAAPNRKMVVEYRNISHFGENLHETSTVTFQVVFDENDSNITVNYKDIDIDGSNVGGLSATSGYQVLINALQYSFNGNILQSKSAWRVFSNHSNPDNLRFKQLNVDGAFRSNFPLQFTVSATSNNTDVSIVTEVDRGLGNSWEPINSESFSELIENTGFYNYVFRITQGEHSRSANLDFNILPLTESERFLLDRAEQEKIDYILERPSEYGLISIDESDQLITEAIELAKETMTEQIQSSPKDYGLISITESESLIAAAIESAKETMTEQIQSSPEEFGLYPLNKLKLIDSETVASLPEGEHLLGTSENIIDLNVVFSDVKSVWVFKEGTFYGWSANSEIMEKITNTGFKPLKDISAGQGFWVKK